MLILNICLKNRLNKNLYIVVNEIAAGNASIKMRNMGVAILATQLKTSTINRLKFDKLYNNHFKILCMEREIVLSSYLNNSSVNNTPANFVTNFTRPIILDSNRGMCDWFEQNNKYVFHLV